jgi:hypothetical protein
MTFTAETFCGDAAEVFPVQVMEVCLALFDGGVHFDGNID